MDKKKVEKLIHELLAELGENTDREGIRDTPKRLPAVYDEIFWGMNKTVEDVVKKTFSVDKNDVIMEKNIHFYSMCEHHLLPFFGTVDIVYQPKEGRVVGLSKFGDVVNVLARRPQLQERLTSQIADAIEQDLMADGVFIRMKATQLCMLIKGEMQQGTQVVTIESGGILQEGGPLRDEAIALMGGIQTDVQTQTL